MPEKSPASPGPRPRALRTRSRRAARPALRTAAAGPREPGLFSDRALLLGTESAFKIGPLIRAVEEQGTRVIRCNLGEPDFPLPAHIRDEVKWQLDNDLTHYCDPQGLRSLRAAIAADVGARRGLAIDPDRRSFGSIGAEGRHYLRISFATALSDLREALTRIEAAATDREGFRAFAEETARLG